jgi:uncharacterized membrane protein
MTEETKNKIKFIFYIVFYPFCRFFEVVKECKGNDFSDFMDEWGYYILGLTFWILGVCGIILIVYGLTYNFVQTIIPIGIISSAIFFTLVLPYIIHKLINRK